MPSSYSPAASAGATAKARRKAAVLMPRLLARSLRRRYWPDGSPADLSPHKRLASSLPLDHLSPEQLAAASLPDELALRLAGAGSGKSRVLTSLIAWLVKGGRVSPAGLLAVTFTNKAAREMLTRV